MLFNHLVSIDKTGDINKKLKLLYMYTFLLNYAYVDLNIKYNNVHIQINAYLFFHKLDIVITPHLYLYLLDKMRYARSSLRIIAHWIKDVIIHPLIK